MNIESSTLEARIGYSFKDKEILTRALSHSSYANELGLGHAQSNERLEFLGDAVLEIVTSEILYFKNDKMKEGELSKLRARLVCEPALNECAKKINLDQYVLLGRGEEKTGGRQRPSIISDCMEALIGAIYIDSGISEAKKFIEENVLFDIENASTFTDNKTMLQELLQSEGRIPVYRHVGEEGPSHDKTFMVEVLVDNEVYGNGSARTKKGAEQQAAGNALTRIKLKKEETNVS